MKQLFMKMDFFMNNDNLTIKLDFVIVRSFKHFCNLVRGN